MAEISKNARVNVITQQFFCACGGEVYNGPQNSDSVLSLWITL